MTRYIAYAQDTGLTSENRKELMNRVVRDLRLPEGATKLIGMVATFSEKSDMHICFATNGYFAEKLKVSTRTIQRWIALAKKLGYISVQLVYRGERIVTRIINIADKFLINSCKKVVEKTQDLARLNLARCVSILTSGVAGHVAGHVVRNNINNTNTCKKEVFPNRNNTRVRARLIDNNSFGYPRPSYAELITSNISDEGLREAFRKYLRQRLIMHKAPTNEMLLEVIKAIQERYYTVERQIEEVNKMTRNCWLYPAKGKEKREKSWGWRRKAAKEPGFSSITQEDLEAI